MSSLVPCTGAEPLCIQQQRAHTLTDQPGPGKHTISAVSFDTSVIAVAVFPY